ncbi:NOL1/NOP2/sun domain protein [Drechmeria coniospora]|uniref:NOL1/NOP2/sun domain protein n=1 Tax=Drechmeria coniospora TaxID=98403 RepID=A0A151GL01_DRECN|nr:NOL1/NOP2/sun domain protein [Drechmeria coniospora]KYK57777.1 NOL1/NOP2/sun domain protein [Drechmeria coniospora]
MSLYHEAADILTSSPSQGGSLKSRIFKNSKFRSPPNQLYALVLETSKWSPVLTEVIQGADLLKLERKLTPALSLLLVHDLLLAKGGIALPKAHGLRVCIEKYKGRLSSELTRARLRRKSPSLRALKLEMNKAAAGEEANYPRWVRINGLRSSVEEQLETTFAGYSRASRIQDVVTKADRHLYMDPHVPNLVAVTRGFDLTATEAYTSGKIILQDKASCFPAYLLDPGPDDGDVIDACAAPGNKTTHLASILRGHGAASASRPQTIYAFEKDGKRAETLDKMVTLAGSKSMTQIGAGEDFLNADPHSDRFKNVGALLLDPSCSGSGIVGRDSMPELHLPAPNPKASHRHTVTAAGAGAEDSELRVVRDDDGIETVMSSDAVLEKRLVTLSEFQVSLLLHAFEFPAARKITYSTCSVHAVENEQVVMAVLRSEVAMKRGWRVLRRERQVDGMKNWPVRGLLDACGGDKAIADGCIRSYKDDGLGVMGFFVAPFVRDDALAVAAGEGRRREEMPMELNGGGVQGIQDDDDDDDDDDHEDDDEWKGFSD